MWATVDGALAARRSPQATLDPGGPLAKVASLIALSEPHNQRYRLMVVPHKK
jgi:hypothetical protein